MYGDVDLVTEPPPSRRPHIQTDIQEKRWALYAACAIKKFRNVLGHVRFRR